MTRISSAMALRVAALALTAWVAACDDGPKGGPSPIVTRAEIMGPASIAPGQSAIYTVTEFLANGTSRALPFATWQSSDASLLQITQDGLATAQPRTGEAVLSARTSVTSTKEVLVLPTGTFRLVGQVTDANPGNVPVFGARVEVTGGPSTTTDGTGRYRLYGVAGDVEIRVTRDGYEPLVQTVSVNAHGTRNFSLPVEGGARNFAGDYMLTVEAAAGCPGSSRPIDEALRRRSYEVRLSQSGSQLTVLVTDGRANVTRGIGNRFVGLLTAAGANFQIEWPYYYYTHAELAERLPDGTILTIYGGAITTGSRDGLSGPLNGWFTHLIAPFTSCPAASFSLTPR
jgi:hypothetical protein